MNQDEIKTVSSKDVYELVSKFPMDIDLVFSGSGVRVPAHAGALVAIIESAKFNIIRAAGTSGGAIIAALAVELLGQPARLQQKAEELAIETDFANLIKTNKFAALARFLTSC